MRLSHTLTSAGRGVLGKLGLRVCSSTMGWGSGLRQPQIGRGQLPFATIF